jgi:uncharacterized protein YjbI with pentapeptide repeats
VQPETRAYAVRYRCVMPAASEPPRWPTCGHDGCTGRALDGHEACLIHADPDVRAHFLASLEAGSALDLRGVTIETDLLAEILSRLQPSTSEPPRIGVAQFDGAHFIGPVEFANGRLGRTEFTAGASFEAATFSGYTHWNGARFGGSVLFRGADFGGPAWFAVVAFQEGANFATAHFTDSTSFADSHFGAAANFHQTRFDDDVTFIRAKFDNDAGFAESAFAADLDFSETTVNGNANFAYNPFTEKGVLFGRRAIFRKTTIRGTADFVGAQFTVMPDFRLAEIDKSATFNGAHFEDGGTAGSPAVGGTLVLSRATFASNVVISAAAAQVYCIESTFQGPATLEFICSDVVLDRSMFSKPSSVAYADRPWGGADLSGVGLDAVEPVPRLLSLRGVDVGNLTLRGLDLSRCLFAGAYNLGGLRLEGPLRFAGVPPPCKPRLHRWRIAVRRWMPRMTLAEEHQYRAFRAAQSTTRSSGRPRFWSRILECPEWNPASLQLPAWVGLQTGESVQVLSPEILTSLYRGLRAGLEDQRNAPGAADFYYGEMQMRELARPSAADRFVLWIYWLFSGYGLRASRALIGFVMAVLVFSFPFWDWGFVHRTSYGTALLQSFESATSLLRSPSVAQLTSVGQILDGFLRLIGTALLGLALFSLRGRIKR